MSPGVSTQRIAERLSLAGLSVAEDVAQRLAGYLDLLAHWNRRINLTALSLDPPSDAAVDRLIVEPVAASTHVAADERRVIDLGSGGGSPAIPLKIALPRLDIVLVESRGRKCAFLRETARHLELTELRVENLRFEEMAANAAWQHWADVVTVRAVRVDQSTGTVVQRLTRNGGRLLWFSNPDDSLPTDLPASIRPAGSVLLAASTRSQLKTFTVE